MKTLRFFYELLPNAPQNESENLLREAQARDYSGRFMAYTCTRKGNILVLEGHQKEWTDRYTGKKISCPCYENGAWNRPDMVGFRLIKIENQYSHALLPKRSDFGGYEWWSGENTWHGAGACYPVTIACLPAQEIVTATRNVNHEKDLDHQRMAFLEAVWHFERIILQVRYLRRLAREARCENPDRRIVDRYVTQLFGVLV